MNKRLTKIFIISLVLFSITLLTKPVNAQFLPYGMPLGMPPVWQAPPAPMLPIPSYGIPDYRGHYIGSSFGFLLGRDQGWGTPFSLNTSSSSSTFSPFSTEIFSPFSGSNFGGSFLPSFNTFTPFNSYSSFNPISSFNPGTGLFQSSMPSIFDTGSFVFNPF